MVGRGFKGPSQHQSKPVTVEKIRRNVMGDSSNSGATLGDILGAAFRKKNEKSLADHSGQDLKWKPIEPLSDKDRKIDLAATRPLYSAWQASKDRCDSSVATRSPERASAMIAWFARPKHRDGNIRAYSDQRVAEIASDAVGPTPPCNKAFIRASATSLTLPCRANRLRGGFNFASPLNRFRALGSFTAIFSCRKSETVLHFRNPAS